MMEKSYFPQRVFIEEKSLDYPFTKRLLDFLSQIPVEVVPDSQALRREFQDVEDAVGRGKKYLLVAEQKGKFVKPCPCTPGYIGCNYYIINLVLHCPFDCSYCILQEYLSSPFITVFANMEILWEELSNFLNKRGRDYLRIGTGELGDSLSLDHITGHSRDLIDFFRGKGPAVLELKTKSVEIQNVLSIEPTESVVVSWSLNSFKIAREEEVGAPSIEERIRAARAVSERGFHLGFHFDPLVFYPGWEEGYTEVIKLLMESVNPSRISWISLGTLRFPRALKPVIQHRFLGTKVIYEELLPGKDGKLRYFKPIRVEMYQKIVRAIKSLGGEHIPLYLCMESREVWEKSLCWRPQGKEDVETSLSPR